MRLVVFGSRGYPTTGKAILHRMLGDIHAKQRLAGDQEMHIISGHSVDKNDIPVGPDWWAEQWAMARYHNRVTRKIISIKDIGGWDAYPGKSAGHVRNARLMQEKPTHGLGLWDGQSRGTAGMLSLVKEAEIPWRIITPADEDFSIWWN